MAPTLPKQQIKAIGSNGQISLGKQFAGRQVLVEEREPGVWLIQTATIVPDRELWLHTPENKERLQRALASAAGTAPTESNVDILQRNLEGGTATPTD